MHPTPLGERIAAARKLAGVSARGLDELASLKPGHTAMIESGAKRDVRSKTLSKLAAALGVSLDWLVNGTGAPPTARRVQAAIRNASAA